MIYGRDMLARPLRLLQALLKEIREGKFDPSATRSGRLVGVDIEEFDPLPARISDAAELPECEQDREVQGPSRQALGGSDDAASYAPVATPLPKEDQPFDPDIEKQMALEAQVPLKVRPGLMSLAAVRSCLEFQSPWQARSFCSTPSLACCA